MRRMLVWGGLLAVWGLVSAGPARADLVVIDGTSANNDGSATGGVNSGGWLYMQSVLESMAAQVPAGTPKVVVNLGADPGTAAGDAIAAAFNNSALPGQGWTMTTVTGADIDPFLTNQLSATSQGILAITTAGLTSGDLTGSKLDQLDADGASVGNFLSSGGSVWAMGEVGSGAWGWLPSVVPGISTTGFGTGGFQQITLTSDGAAAFPGLTSDDVASVTWNSGFQHGTGGLTVLGTAPAGDGSAAVILGNLGAPPAFPPVGVPAPPAVVLLAVGACAMAARRRRTV
ncbi:hypothetical protein [Fimbriiglobus ruber]|uniref:PEP-CTERM protein-sorting domain-containing protein n=1 Tax=Fimbriiglobus ruber TaxID=1908690 RepID=A0A225DFT6_9BACT|nr:hypothetical protein [Fimbriiglobus ruber]OWK36216.1 hypothetical protein FRUB_08779 [Fimbriiglobus ruber]